MWDSLSCLLTLLESFGKNNPEMGIDSVARQMHQKTVQHYWVNIVKRQVTGGCGPTLRDTFIQPMDQVSPKWMPLGVRLAVNTHNMGGHFVQSVKNARWSMSPQEAGDGLESLVEFQVQIRGHNQRECEDKWQGCQDWTDEKLASKLTKDDQQPVLLLPARWWPDMLPEFEN